MQSLSISRFLILAIVAKYGPMNIGAIQHYYHRVPTENQKQCSLELGLNTIRGIVCYLVNEELLHREGRSIGMTQKGLLFFQSYLQILGTLKNPLSTEEKLLKKKIKSKRDLKKSQNKVKKLEHNNLTKKVENTSQVIENEYVVLNKPCLKNNEFESGIIQQFVSYFDTIINDYRWAVTVERLGSIMKNLSVYWERKLSSLKEKGNYPPETTTMMIGWLGLTSEKCGADGRADIEVGLEFCWKYYLKEKGYILNLN